MSSANKLIIGGQFIGDISNATALPPTVITTFGNNITQNGASYDFSSSVITLPTLTIQLRHGTASELAITTLQPSEPGITTDTNQLFIGDGTTVGGIEVGVQRCTKNFTTGTLNDLIGPVTSPTISIINGSPTQFYLNAAANGEWIPLFYINKPTSSLASTFNAGGAVIRLDFGTNGTSTGSGGPGGGNRYNFVNNALLYVGAGNGGNPSSTGDGGAASQISNFILILPGNGGDSTGSGRGGNASSLTVATLKMTCGSGGTASTGDGGSGGSITLGSPFTITIGNGGNGGSASGTVGGNGGTLGGQTFKLITGAGGNGGTSSSAVGGQGGGMINVLRFIGGNGGNGGAFSGGNGGTVGFIDIEGGSGGAGTGSSNGGAGSSGGSITLNGAAGSTSGGAGGAAGTITMNGGVASDATNGARAGQWQASAFTISQGGDLNLSAVSGSNGGSLILSNGSNYLKTCGGTQYTFNLPTSVASGELASLPIMTSNTSSTITFNSNGQTETIYNTSASTLASATITLPTTTIAGQIVRYISAGAITTLTVSGTVDIGAAATSLAANGVLTYQAINTSGHFIRII